MSHTIGPWKVENADRGYVVSSRSGSYDVCLVRDIGKEDNEANARLIAAAPELYEALESVLQECAENNVFLGSGCGAVEALAKARGEQQ